MAKKSLIVKSKKKQKYSVRKYSRCSVCGRSRGVLSHYGLCRICFREAVCRREIPGFVKSSW